MSLIEQIQNQARQLPPEKQKEALDFIAFLKQRVTPAAASQAERKENLRKAFATLAKLGTFSDITDPVDWQRQIRKDRHLPGRGS